MKLSAMAAAGLVVAIAACSQPAPTPTPAPEPPKPTPVERGKYLVTAMGCNDCHTPTKMGPNGPEPDMSRMLSGHPSDLKMPAPPVLPKNSPWVAVVSGTSTAWAGPWGVSYTANLTPDQNTGLGIWTEAVFVKAIREGKHMGTSRPILPPMPWPAFRNLNDDDLKAIYAYLRTIPAVHNQVPDPIIAPAPPAAPGK